MDTVKWVAADVKRDTGEVPSAAAAIQYLAIEADRRRGGTGFVADRDVTGVYRDLSYSIETSRSFSKISLHTAGRGGRQA